MDDAVDAAHPVKRLVQPAVHDLVAQERRQEDVALDDAAVHVGHVQRAIGTGGAEDGTEALVVREQELALGVGVLPRDDAVGLGQDRSANQAARGLADEDVAAVLVRELVAAIHRSAPRSP